jgi:DNA-binding transcriptional ArsR family regulator
MSGRAGAVRQPKETALATVLELRTEEQVAALLHPVRRRVLAALAEPTSPADVGRQLGLPAQVINYHVHALERAGLAREVGTRRKRNLVEHRFRAIARSFTLSSSLALTEQQRRRLQSDVTLQQLVRAGDSIRSDALRLLETLGAGGAPADSPPDPATDAADAAAQQPAGHAAAAIEIDVELATSADRVAFVRAISDAIHAAAAPFRRKRRTSHATPYRMHLAIYPIPPEP